MRLIILGLARVLDMLMVLGLLVVLSAGIYSLWLNALNKPSLIYDGLTLILLALLIWLAGKGLNIVIQRKLDFDPIREYWQPPSACLHSQLGEARINPCLTFMVYLLPIYCLLPIFYSILFSIIFWILILILLAASIFCLSEMKNGLVHKDWQVTYYPRTQAFINFYLTCNGEWEDEQELLFQKIDPSSIDFIVAQDIQARLCQKINRSSTFFYNYIDTSYGAGFDATPANLANARESYVDSFDAMLKTHAYLG